MSLQLVLGSSGSGKSYRVNQYMIAESLKDIDCNYIMIVPEQFTLQTQKDIVSMHPRHGIMNVDVLSFLRLSYRIFEELGKSKVSILEETGKSMLVRKALEEKKEELSVFKADMRKQGFVEEIKSLISELLQYSIEPQQLLKMIDVTQNKPMLCGKLHDTVLVYESFQKMLENKYITAEEVLEVLCDVVIKSKILKNSVICFDGFTGFTPNQYKLIRSLFSVSKKVMITVTLDPREDYMKKGEEFQLFYLSKKTIHQLFQIAKETSTEIDEPWFAGEKDKVPYRFGNSPALASLEKNLFRYPYECCNIVQNDISLYAAGSTKKEIQYVLEKIQYLLREKEYRYRDIAVVTGDIGTYESIIEREFEKAGICFFIDNKKDVRLNPFVDLLRALLDVFVNHFTYEGVFRYLRTGLLEISRSEIDMLENYVLAYGIRGYGAWNKVWKSRGKKASQYDFDELNGIRARVMEPLIPFYDAIKRKDCTVEDYTRAMYEFIVQQRLYEKLEQYCELFEKEEKPLLVKEFRQIYRIVMELFDKIVELLGTDSMSLKEYQEILDTGYSEMQVGLIPPGVDQLMVGDIERTRLKDIKALFFIGVNDGIIPKSKESGGIFSDRERELLSENKMELAPTKRQNAYIEQFYLYFNLTKASEKLFISYSKLGADGKAQKPSFLIGKIKKIFPDLTVTEEDREEVILDKILGGDRGWTYLLDGLGKFPVGKVDIYWKELFSYYMRQENFRKELRRLVQGVYYTNEEKKLSRAVVNALYGTELHNSVTRLEQYASCAFAHFLAYGLGLQERKEFRVAIPDIGDLFHKSIEIFSKNIQREGVTWRELGKEDMEGQRDLFVHEAVIQAVEGHDSPVIFSSKRNEYLVNRLERMTSRTIWALCQQISQGDFEPSGYEVYFSPVDHLAANTITLDQQSIMRLKGRIDRIDVLEEEETVCIKVIDYKSGETTFDLTKIYYGLQLQLVVYLNAVMEMEKNKTPLKKVIPAGIFYYNIQDPMIERLSSEEAKEKVEEAILKELKMNGLVNRDKNILKRLDRVFEEEQSAKSTVIPVELTTKGNFSAYSSVAGEEEFKALSTFVENKITQFGKEIVDGNTKAVPYQMDKRTACDYCKFDGICGFDRKLPGNQYRKLMKRNKDDIWEEINEQYGVDRGTEESN
ncbi:helicase-exonuclease AddAB subunit AddB [Anaeromicropila populeti]|uniref:DNA helicase/exodeoxyribonuclease V, subunit B n=1 Tax=Anaeromicropila populeti TaxID=37658 RepID=A0A1I6HPU7_9FIRM|nr:helicase-exonuclease AddAB subunit AddB [Anaeromicropila populeti]SFR56483.1 DNA helicase/exodeoxyribonuclease V, subunit B [Anaeromicropila populeti]